MFSLKDERLTQKVALAVGLMSFVPLLFFLLAFSVLIFPKIRGSAAEQEFTYLLLVGITGSIIAGYVILKMTVRAVMDLVGKAREVKTQIGQPEEPLEGDEIGELARTFSRVTHELEHKIEELESSRALVKRLLSRIGTAIASYEGIDNLLELIVENATSALEAQMGSLMLLDGEKQELIVKTAWAAGGQQASIAPMKFGEGIAGSVAKECTPLRGTGSPSSLGFSNGHGKECAVLCIPLVIREHAIGVLSVLREDPHKPFTEDDEMLLVGIGSQVAVAIENYRLNLDVERTYLETVTALALAVEAKEPYTAGHSRRVGFYAIQIAEALGVEEEIKKLLQESGVLHDVGKIGIKDDILLKPGALTSDEFRIMQQHSLIGEAILKPLRSMTKVAELVRHHHERYDGTGYPDGLKAEEIPLGARILVVADSYDAMMTDRPYRKRLTLEQAKEELRKGAGTQFDPKAVEAFLKVLAAKEARMAAHPPGIDPASDPRG